MQSLCPFLAARTCNAGSMSQSESFRPLPEPEPPDFERLPVGTQGLFVQRQERLPIGHVRTSIGAQAIMTNESRALRRFEVQNALTWELSAPLGTWHRRAVHDRISAARPDLLPPRRPSGPYILIRAPTPWDRVQRRLIDLHLWNLLNGTYTWLRNRAIDLRAAFLRLTLRQ
jgi:hypothetical protein